MKGFLKQIFVIIFLFFATFFALQTASANDVFEQEMLFYKNKIEKTDSGKKFLKELHLRLSKMSDDQKFAFLNQTQKNLQNIKDQQSEQAQRIYYTLYRLYNSFDYYQYLADNGFSLEHDLVDFLPDDRYTQALLKLIPKNKRRVSTHFYEPNMKNMDSMGYVYDGDNRVFLNMKVINKNAYSSLGEKYYSIRQTQTNEMMHVFLHLLGFTKKDCIHISKNNCQNLDVIHEFLSDYATISDTSLTKVDKDWFVSQALLGHHFLKTGRDYNSSEGYRVKNQIFANILGQIIPEKRLAELYQANTRSALLSWEVLAELEDTKVISRSGIKITGWEKFREKIIARGVEIMKELHQNYKRK